jgi:acyl-coenzyme A synthetase/AMP-(fatty) acid ligase/acyl carrier protein
MRVLITGGESFSAENAARWQAIWDPPSRIINAYGPSESTVTATDYRVGARERTGKLPIGRPVSGIRVYVLDRALEPVLPGTPGEICIAGIGLARGYLNRPAATAARFLPDPYAGEAGARLYRSGDLGRHLPVDEDPGPLEFLGRFDEQVKIHGHRIELAEIAAALGAHPSVAEAIVMVREDQPGHRILAAYLRPEPDTDRAPGTRELRTFLGARVPEHMIPNAFVALERWPLNPNGKVDRKALPAPGDRNTERDATPPRNETETQLVAIWKALLKLERVGVYEDFMDLGGNSLLAFQMVSRIRDEFSLELPLAAVFASPTIAELAEAIAQKLAAQSDPAELARLLAEIEAESAGEAS